jgi:hypothetical protein
MQLFGRHRPVLRALLLGACVCALCAVPRTAAAQPWSPLVREYRGVAASDVYFEAHSIWEPALGTFEIRLLYEPVAWVCLRRDRDGDCIDESDRSLLSTRIRVIRIRCQDMSFEEVEVWVRDFGLGGWRQLRAMDFRHPPGWRYDIAPGNSVATARDLVCATVPP